MLRLVPRLLAVFAILLGPALALAGLPAPSFLPGQPMLVGNQVLMIWNPVPGAAGYVVFRNGEPVGRTTANQYLEPAPEASGTYRYQVAAEDASGLRGELSEPGVVKIQHIEPPKRVVAWPDPASGTIGVLWDQVDGAVIYNVYRSADGAPFALVASVQDVTYVDGDVQAGVRYAYRITARDATGAESAPSAEVEAQAARPERARRDELVFRALPTREVYRLERLGTDDLREVSFLGLGPAGKLWVVTPRTGRIHRLDRDGIEEAVLGPFVAEATGYALRPHKLGFADDGDLFVTDALNGVLARLSPAGELRWARGILTPPPQNAEVWEGFPDRVRSLPATPSSVALVGDEIWVTDQRFQLLYRFSQQGELLGYLTHGRRKSERFRLPGVGEVAAFPDGRVLLTFPLSHYAAVFDRELQLLAELGADVRGYVGGFVGIHGAQPLEGGRVLLTDPAVGSVQVFDAASGAYLYHLAGPEPRPDPAYDQRADFAYHKPNMAVTDGRGRFWLYDAAARALVCLEQAGPVTPPPGGE